MKRYLRKRAHSDVGPWVRELAHALIERGTEARRWIEADCDDWSGARPGSGSRAPDVAVRLQAKIRALFNGLAGTSLPGFAWQAGRLPGGRFWR